MRKIGSLQTLETHSRIEPKAGQQAQHFILLHGYGADAHDLQSLGEVIESPEPTHFIFPQGPLEVPLGVGGTGRAWWNIDLAGIQLAAAQGKPRDISNESPAFIPELRKKMLHAIEALKIPWNQIILGGFSQGAMLATDLFLHAPETPKALVVLSGALVNKDNWKTVASQRAGAPFFMCHGTQDSVLAHRGAAQLETFLIQAGMKGKLLSFGGAHEIPMTMIQKLNEFLQGISKSP